MEELERGLKAGSLICYVCWSAVVFIVNIVIASMFWSNIVRSIPRGDRELGALVGCNAIWLIVQSYFAISSYTRKSLFQANVACCMMSISLVCLIMLELLSTAFLINDIYNPGGWFAGLGVSFFIVVSVSLLIHIFVNLKGAFQVKKILLERANIEIKLVERSFDHHA